MNSQTCHMEQFPPEAQRSLRALRPTWAPKPKDHAMTKTPPEIPRAQKPAPPPVQTSGPPKIVPWPPSIAMFSLLDQAAISPALTNRSDLELDPEFLKSIADHGVLQPILVRSLPAFELVEPDLTRKCWTIKSEGAEVFFSEDEAAARTWLFGQTGSREPLAARYEIVAGERRWRANAAAQRTKIPAIVMQLNEKAARALRLIENLQRKDLKPLDEAVGYRDMLADGYTVGMLADRLGRSRSHVFSRLRLLDLVPAVRDAVASGKLPQTIAELIAGLPSATLQSKALQEILNGGPSAFDIQADDWMREAMTYRQAKAYLAKNFQTDLKTALWNLKTDGIADTVACAVCPQRSGTDPDAFPDIVSSNVCTAPDCFARKAAATRAEILAEKAPKTGVRLSPEENAKAFETYGPAANFVEAGASANFGGRFGAPEELLGKLTPAPVYGVDSKGRLKKLYRKEEVKAALKASGKLKPRGRDLEADHQQREARWARERVTEQAVRRAVIGKIEVGLRPLQMRDLWHWLYRLLAQDWNLSNIAKERGVSRKDLAPAKWTEPLMVGLVVELAMRENSSASKVIEEMAAAFGVDVAAVKKAAIPPPVAAVKPAAPAAKPKRKARR